MTTNNEPSETEVARLLYIPLKLDQAGKECALRQGGSAAKTVPKGDKCPSSSSGTQLPHH